MNPEDVFPRRNLPDEAEDWGRKVEDRIIEAEYAILGTKDAVFGLNRNNVTTFEGLARQLDGLKEQVQRVDALNRMRPISFARNDARTNFGLSSSGWNTIASITFTPPADGTCELNAEGAGQLRSTTTTGNVEVLYRLNVNGAAASAPFPGDFNSPDGTWRNTYFVAHAWSLNVREGQTFTVYLEANPTSASSWSSGTGSTASLTAFATFTSA